MKKLSLVLGMMFFGGFVFAQSNVATVTETGKSDAGYVQQQGMTNTAIIYQVGDNIKADAGDSYVNSLFGLLTAAKGVTQVGNSNTGIISQINGLTGTLAGDGPIAGMYQQGNINKATISQSHNSLWMQEYAWVQQVGDNNTSLQNQQSEFGFSHVYQVGNGNRAETQQLGGYNQKANIFQNGNYNKATQIQGSNSLSYTEGNLSELTQNGSSNTATTTQNTNNNKVNLTQNGYGNSANVLQETGNVNVVNLTQDGSARADIVQDGSNNTLMGLGMDIMATSLNGSVLDLDQVGSGNVLHLQQTNGASATVMQNGITNTSVVIQN